MHSTVSPILSSNYTNAPGERDGWGTLPMPYACILCALLIPDPPSMYRCYCNVCTGL